MNLEDMNVEQYEYLLKSGHMWNVYPNATGNWQYDLKAKSLTNNTSPSDIQVMYQPVQIRMAAEWIVKNNPYMKDENVDALEDRIWKHCEETVDCMVNFLEQDSDYYGTPRTGTAGYFVEINWEDENMVNLDVLVDPSVGRPIHFCNLPLTEFNGL